MRRPGWLEDPSAPSLLVFTAVVLAGFATIGFGWKVAARTLDVAFQTPALISGGLGGLTLILIGAGLANVQVSRRMAAGERAANEDLLDEAAALLAVAKNSRRSS